MPYLRRVGPLRSFRPLLFQSSSGTGRPRASSLLARSYSRWRILYQCYFPDHTIKGSGWRSGQTRIEHPPRCSTRRNYLLDFRQEILHQPLVFHEDGKGCLAEAGSPDSIIRSKNRALLMISPGCHHRVLPRWG